MALGEVSLDIPAPDRATLAQWKRQAWGRLA